MKIEHIITDQIEEVGSAVVWKTVNSRAVKKRMMKSLTSLIDERPMCVKAGFGITRENTSIDSVWCHFLFCVCFVFLENEQRLDSLNHCKKIK